MKRTNPWETYLPVGTFRNELSFATNPCSILNLKYLNYSMPKRVKNGEIQETGNLYIKILSHQYWTSSFTTILRILVRRGMVSFVLAVEAWKADCLPR